MGLQVLDERPQLGARAPQRAGIRRTDLWSTASGLGVELIVEGRELGKRVVERRCPTVSVGADRAGGGRVRRPGKAALTLARRTMNELATGR
jgi:hypothetical protein